MKNSRIVADANNRYAEVTFMKFGLPIFIVLYVVFADAFLVLYWVLVS